jgi:hypothetical protein
MDVFNLVDGNIIKHVFLTNGTTNAWQVWEKPKNCKFINIITIGGGGGGGAGFSASINTATGGGGGGGSAITKGFFISNTLPDRLYIQVGPGGAGGTNNPVVAATAGSISYVSIQPNTTAGNVILASGAADAGAGGAGTGAGAGGAGAAGTVFSQTNFFLSTLGNIQSIAGTAGGAGGANVPTNVTFTIPTSGGAGGGGVTAAGTGSAGANITGAGFVPTTTGGAAQTGAGVNGDNGNVGFNPMLPNFNSFNRNTFFNTGGAGGGTSILANGGTGGNGSYGSGGGGGGASFAGTVNGGAGGKGGDGIVIINSW